MAYRKRKGYGKCPPSKRVRRTYRRRAYISAGGGPIPRSVSAKQGDTRIVKIARTGNMQLITTVANTDYFNALSFALTDLTNYTDFTHLYDQYRFVVIKAEWTPLSTVAATTTDLPVLVDTIDLDDANTPSSRYNITDHENSKVQGVMSCNNSRPKYVRWLKPRAAVGLYGGSTFTSYGAAPKNQWIDCNSAGVPHYGYKWMLASSGTTAIIRAYLTFTYYFEFKLAI